MASSTSLGQLIATEWIDGNSIKRSQPMTSAGDIVNLDFAEELYGTLLMVFAQMCRIYSKTISLPKQRQVKEALGRLHLWGRDFQDGKLARVLGQSDDLRNTVIELLCQIGKVILDLVDLDDCDSDFAEEVRGLKNLVARSRMITRASDSSESDSGDEFVSELRLDINRGDASEESIRVGATRLSENVEGKGDPQLRLEQSSQSPEAKNSRRPSKLRRDSPRMYTPDSSEDEDEASDHGTLLECSIDCLMDLIPTMEQSLAHLQSGGIQTKVSSRVPFSVSELALPWVQNVSDKFTNADNALIERLGEANWQRYMTLRAMTEQRNQSLGIADVVADNIRAIQIFQTAPQSIFKPLSLFHDSGLGSSVPTLPRYAVSAASHTSFLSSLADDGTLALRVPPTPVEVDLGNPFQCEICGHLLSNIKNRVDWKIHVFADLQPYICTFESCAKDLITFPTRSLWGSHEFEEHRVMRSWKCPECTYVDSTAPKLEEHLHRYHGEAITLAQLPLVVSAAEIKRPLPIEDQECPLCKFIPGKSQRNFVKHVGRHMESVALAVLPRDATEESDRSFEGSIVSEDELSVLPEGSIDDFEEDYFFVPLDFRLHTSLKGRDQELQLLDEGLFSAKREHGTASVVLHGHTISGKVQLAQHYINLSRHKFPGGIFWFDSKSNEELHASLLVLARKYIWEADELEKNTDHLARAVTFWFTCKSDWLIIINNVRPSSFDLTNEVFLRLATPNSRHSSLIYITDPDYPTNSYALPLDPTPLQLQPPRKTWPRTSEQNVEPNLGSALVRTEVNADRQGTLPADASANTINIEMRRDHDPTHSESGPISDIYPDEHFSQIGGPGLAEFSEEPSTIKSEKLRVAHRDSDDGPKSDDKTQVHHLRTGENKKVDKPVSTYLLVPENYDTSGLSERLWSKPNHEPQATGPVYPLLNISDYHYALSGSTAPLPNSYNQLSPDRPREMPDQSAPSGSNQNALFEIPLFDDSKSGLLMQSLLCEYPGCSFTSKSISEYTEHCEVSHGDILENMSKRLSQSNEDPPADHDTLLLERSVTIPAQVPWPKLRTQNLSADLFHKFPSHTTGAISPMGYDYMPRLYDIRGEQKVAPNGRLLGGREYTPRPFLLAGKGDTVFMLAAECARLLGYRDSDHLFHKSPSLYRITLDQAGKDGLINQGILPQSYRSHQIEIVTARSMFREFGSRIVSNGRKVYDDYWEDLEDLEDWVESAQSKVSPEDHVAGRSDLEEHSLTAQMMKGILPPLNMEVPKHENLPLKDALYADYNYRELALRADEDMLRKLAPPDPDHSSSELVNDNAILAPSIINQESHQQNQDEASQAKPKNKCPYCSAIFMRHHNLKSHLLTHSKEKSFVCQTCDARFRRLHDLKRHTKLHTSEKIYICSGCRRAFACLEALTRHLKLSGICAGQQVSANSYGNSDGGPIDNATERNILESISPIEPEGAGSQDEDPAKDSQGTIIDPPRPQSPALGTVTASDLDADSIEVSEIKIKSVATLLNERSSDKIRCVCGQEEYPGLPKSARDAFESATYHNRSSKSAFAVNPNHLGSLLIQCYDCEVWQHGNCVGIPNAASCPDEYFCDQCSRLQHIITVDPSTGLNRSVYKEQLSLYGEKLPQLEVSSYEPPYHVPGAGRLFLQFKSKAPQSYPPHYMEPPPYKQDPLSQLYRKGRTYPPMEDSTAGQNAFETMTAAKDSGYTNASSSTFQAFQDPVQSQPAAKREGSPVRRRKAIIMPLAPSMPRPARRRSGRKRT